MKKKMFSAQKRPHQPVTHVPPRTNSGGTGSWEAQKSATLAGVPNYDYVTPLYWGKIPTQVIEQGFWRENHRNEPAIPQREGNYPFNRRDKGQPGRDHSAGYVMLSPQEQALEWARIFVNQPQTVAGFYRRIRRDDVSDRMVDDGSFEGVHGMHVRDPDPGFPIAFAQRPPFLGQGGVWQ